MKTESISAESMQKPYHCLGTVKVARRSTVANIFSVYFDKYWI